MRVGKLQPARLKQQLCRAIRCSRAQGTRSRFVRCSASKTTRGRAAADIRSTEVSSSSSRSPEVVPPASPSSQDAPKKSFQDHARDMQQRLASVVHYLTPKQEGDAGDVLMIGISMAVFIYLAMQMYRLYFYVYLQLGVMDMMQ